MKTITCKKCKSEKEESAFTLTPKGTPRYGHCKKCQTQLTRDWRARNREAVQAKSKAYNDATSKQRAQWYAENKDYAGPRNNAYTMSRRKTDPQFNARHLATARINGLLRYNHKRGRAVTELGCTVEQFREHIASKFQPGMTWENRGKNTWHIDHIMPLSSFDLLDPVQSALANHFTNLQPLWWHENIKKRNKVTEIRNAFCSTNPA